MKTAVVPRVKVDARAIAITKGILVVVASVMADTRQLRQAMRQDKWRTISCVLATVLFLELVGWYTCLNFFLVVSLCLCIAEPLGARVAGEVEQGRARGISV